jgi:hypothetical protein
MSIKADAERWRYTQQEGYFCVYHDDGVSVGVLKYFNDIKSYSGKTQHPLSHCIEGRGATLKKAIDAARRKVKKVSKKSLTA